MDTVKTIIGATIVATSLLLGSTAPVSTAIGQQIADNTEGTSNVDSKTPKYDGSNEPDNPNCPPINEYEDKAAYKKHGHDCAPPDNPENPGPWGSNTDQKFNSHFWYFGDNGHTPGADDTSLAFRNWPVDKSFNLQYFEYVAAYAPWGPWGTCSLTDGRAAGIDGGNDDHGGQYHSSATDKGILNAVENSGFNKNYGYFKFDGPSGSPGPEDDRNINLNHTDAMVGAFGNCASNPEEPGWYRFTIWFNGTSYQGEKIEYKGMSQWNYICECENRQEAINKLGQPGTNPDNSWKDTTVPKSDESTATPTSSPGEGDTATPTSSPGEGDTATPTSSPGEGDTATPTSSPGEGDTATPTSSPGEGDTATPTASPTSANGPGLGVVTAVIALLVASVKALRHN